MAVKQIKKGILGIKLKDLEFNFFYIPKQQDMFLQLLYKI
jgi:hypothetical protein